jgi:type VI secretion system Hcp family effector
MPLTAFLDSPIKGAGIQKGREGKTPVIAANHHAAPDAAQVFVIRKKLDLSTPEFHSMMEAGTVFDKWVLDFWHMPRSGPECKYVSVTLTEAKIAWINIVMPDLQVQENYPMHEYEDIAFTFKKASYAKFDEPNM